MAVYLSTTNPTGDAESLLADPVFLIRGPVDVNTGRVIYYLTRALEPYAVPDPVPNDGKPTIAEYFDRQPEGLMFMAAKLEDGRRSLSTTAHATPPQSG